VSACHHKFEQSVLVGRRVGTDVIDIILPQTTVVGMVVGSKACEGSLDGGGDDTIDGGLDGNALASLEG
jgi:hypothetical protein